LEVEVVVEERWRWWRWRWWRRRGGRGAGGQKQHQADMLV
jgi:hypothetical protein